MDGSYRFRGYGASVRVDAPDDIALSELRSLVAPEVQAEGSAAGPSDLHLTRWNGEYRLVHGERRYGPYRELQNALRGVANAIHFLLGKRSPLTFLHAGAVEMDGGAVVFPGRGRYGKSALVAALVEQGCGYLSDEFAVVSQEGAVFPLSRPIRVPGADRADYLVPEGVGTPGGYRCSAVIFTRYVREGTWNPERLTRGQAALEAIPQALKSTDHPDQVLQSVVALVKDGVCYRGDRGSEEPTVETIRSLLAADDPAQEVRI